MVLIYTRLHGNIYGTGSSDIKEQSQEKKGRKVRVVWLKYPVKCCNLNTVDDYCR
jgi:hypothetical protein